MGNAENRRYSYGFVALGSGNKLFLSPYWQRVKSTDKLQFSGNKMDGKLICVAETTSAEGKRVTRDVQRAFVRLSNVSSFSDDTPCRLSTRFRCISMGFTGSGSTSKI